VTLSVHCNLNGRSHCENKAFLEESVNPKRAQQPLGVHTSDTHLALARRIATMRARLWLLRRVGVPTYWPETV